MMTVEKETLTFVMPAYNEARHIDKIIRSLQAQGDDDWRLVVADDCSTDATAGIVEKMAEADPRIRLLRTERNNGCVYLPRKAAIMAADTTWVAPLDADDWVESDYLHKLRQRQSETDADIVYPVLYKVPGGRFIPDTALTRGDGFTGAEAVLLTVPRWQIGAGGGMVRRSLYEEAFREVERYEDPGNAYSDEMLTRCLLARARKVACAETAYFYRMNSGSVTHDNRRFFEYTEHKADLRRMLRDHFAADTPVDSRIRQAAEETLFEAIYEALDNIAAIDRSSTGSDWRAIRKEYMSKLRIMRDELDMAMLRRSVGWKYILPLSLGIGAAYRFRKISNRKR